MAKSSENPLVDLGTTTVEAFNIIKKKEKDNDKKAILGIDDTLENTSNRSVKVKVYTPEDKQNHTYFHSLSIDKQVEDFMGTAELRCPYDSDLMEYWEIIRAYCIIYGTNQGEANYKILFIGRVRQLKQEGYELVITFQDYGWKFKQLVSQSYANDNVLNKNGYTIMKLMFEALKIDSWVISPIAKSRLQQVGIDSDGNLTLNKEKVEEMPDLLERLKKSNPNDAINQYTVENKLKESKEANFKDINYTLKYEEPTPVMKEIASSGDSGGFTAGSGIYAQQYGSASGGGGGASNVSASGNPRPPNWVCSTVKSTSINAAMKLIWSYNRGYANDYSSAQEAIVNYARNSPGNYSSQAVPCLNTLAQYCTRSDKRNAASSIKSVADSAYGSARVASNVVKTASSVVKTAQKAYTAVTKAVGGLVKNAANTLKSIFRL